MTIPLLKSNDPCPYLLIDVDVWFGMSNDIIPFCRTHRIEVVLRGLAPEAVERQAPTQSVVVNVTGISFADIPAVDYWGVSLRCRGGVKVVTDSRVPIEDAVQRNGLRLFR